MHGGGSSSLGSTGGPYTMSQMLRSSPSSRLAVRSRLWHKDSTCRGAQQQGNDDQGTYLMAQNLQSVISQVTVLPEH